MGQSFCIETLKKNASYTGVLTSDELHEAERLWILFVQRKATLESRQTKNLQRQLGTFSDECDVIRCKGRLENAGITEGAKYHILLQRKERFTHLLIDKIHKENFHCGVSQTIVSIRQRCWIPKIKEFSVEEFIEEFEKQGKEQEDIQNDENNNYMEDEIICISSDEEINNEERGLDVSKMKTVQPQTVVVTKTVQILNGQ